MATQLDIVRRQAEAAARNAAAQAQGELRRDASLVGQASRWAGRAMAEGEATLRARTGKGPRRSPPPRQARADHRSRPAGRAPDGYVRRSPVQPIRVAEGYRRRLMLRAAGIAALVAAACAGLCILHQLGVFGR